jgi:hypothetical protein
MQRIFTVVDRFEIAGKGLALIGITDDDSLIIRDGSRVTIKRPGMDDIETFALGLELLRNTWSPHKPRNIALLIPNDVGLENVPPKSEVWSVMPNKHDAPEL